MARYVVIKAAWSSITIKKKKEKEKEKYYAHDEQFNINVSGVSRFS